MSGSEGTGRQAGSSDSGRSELEHRLAARALTLRRVVRFVGRSREYDQVCGDVAERRPGGG
jgi:hypothetical protein